ncbi:hypothetical protein D3C71_1317750 [compost metagenome]
MRLRYLEFRKAKSRLKKTKKLNSSKKIEQDLLLELTEFLDEHLLKYDRVFVEVDLRAIGEFMNILTDSLITVCDYSQVDKNKFIFYSKNLDF